jgi:hypothetical protein
MANATDTIIEMSKTMQLRPATMVFATFGMVPITFAMGFAIETIVSGMKKMVWV